MQESEKNALVVFTGRGLAVAVSLMYVLIIPRFLGAEGFGFYSLWFSQLFLMITFLDLGSSDNLKRFLPSFFKQDEGHARSLIHLIIKAKLFVLPFLVAFVLVQDEKLYFAATLLASVFATLSVIYYDVAFSRNMMVMYAKYPLYRKILRMLLLLGLFYLFSFHGIIAALVLTEALLLVLFFFGCETRYRPKALHYHNRHATI